jgi:hypothetical protein
MMMIMMAKVALVVILLFRRSDSAHTRIEHGPRCMQDWGEGVLFQSLRASIDTKPILAFGIDKKMEDFKWRHYGILYRVSSNMLVHGGI